MRKSLVFGELLLTVGLILLLFAFYESYWTNIESGKLQDQAQEKLDEEWRNPRENISPAAGEAFARMYIPAFGPDYQFAVLEGTSDDDLLRGPGRYSDSQMPGEKGNFAVAGHRVGKGAPFNDLGYLETCDSIIIETATQYVTYKVLPIDAAPADCFTSQQQEKITSGQYAGITGRHITLPGDIGVTFPVPGLDSPVEDASEGILTLTTCHPQFSNAERMIIHAMETEARPKSEGMPPELSDHVTEGV